MTAGLPGKLLVANSSQCANKYNLLKIKLNLYRYVPGRVVKSNLPSLQAKGYLNRPYSIGAFSNRNPNFEQHSELFASQLFACLPNSGLPEAL